jgi:hypothetical protein
MRTGMEVPDIDIFEPPNRPASWLAHEPAGKETLSQLSLHPKTKEGVIFLGPDNGLVAGTPDLNVNPIVILIISSRQRPSTRNTWQHSTW